jgi:hypothetical protein
MSRPAAEPVEITSPGADAMPKYAALFYRNEAAHPAPNTSEMGQLYQAWGAFNQEVAKSGVMALQVPGLQPTATATTVRVRDGKILTTDGPFAETKEQLAGLCIFECKDLDEAIQWASKIPDASTGSVEVRPVWEG